MPSTWRLFDENEMKNFKEMYKPDQKYYKSKLDKE